MADDGRLFSRTTQAIVYNWKPDPVQTMLDFDFLCKRELPSIAALVQPGTSRGNTKAFFGTEEMILPVYGSTADASSNHPSADVFINYASFRSAYASSMKALEMESIKTVVIIAEGVPISDVRRLIASAKAKGKVIIGPATVGGIQAGSFKIGELRPQNIALWRKGMEMEKCMQ